ncbi:HAD family hydrolase [Nocardioides caeni]|uniref:HAD family hydrolase n=1 Tax=Nocardioides caeni TaxID=574700 RepID=A0A4S8NRS1_9ACTN|nr:hypothetical protein [Nocardioides caeni]THV18702.1 hypothetical protein E9934_03625 [Nocardioides caeni]
MLVALDLDRTLIYSRTSMGPVPDDLGLRIVEWYDGAPLSHVTDRAWALLGELMTVADVVPVTTRSPAQLARVGLPRVPGHAICANGAVLLVDGEPDPEWQRATLRAVAGADPLADVRPLLEAVADEPWVRLVRDVEDVFCYLVAESREQIPLDWVAEVAASAALGGWGLSLQGRKVYLVPDALSKGAGLQRLAERLDPTPVTLAAGDSLLDAPLLLAADHAIRPAHGELHDLDWSAPGVGVTARSGILAGEDVLDWALARVHARRDVSGLAPS